MKKLIIFLVSSGLLLLGGFFYFENLVNHSHGKNKEVIIFKIEKGDGNAKVAQKLTDSGLISGKIYFYYYVRSKNLISKILPGEYSLSGAMTIPEIALTITQEKKDFISVTVQEGLRSDEIAKKLTEKGLDGAGFLELIKNPSGLVEAYAFLKQDKVKNLEGYLFPDTYFFSKKDTPESVVRKFLDNFDKKLSADLKTEVANQQKTIFEIVTMASIVEKEALIDYKKGVDDQNAKIIAGLFWDRIKNGQALQSCATLAFIFKDPKPKAQYSFSDTRTDSPYNTYLNRGLTPGPISNPGILAIRAAIYPTKTDYNYFLSDENRNLLFAKTIEEHLANKQKAGL
jgi:UPF0755 protein